MWMLNRLARLGVVLLALLAAALDAESQEAMLEYLNLRTILRGRELP